jgi:hypothetical protein
MIGEGAVNFLFLLTAINLLMFVSMRNVVVSFVDRCLVFKFGGLPGLFHTLTFPYFW